MAAGSGLSTKEHPQEWRHHDILALRGHGTPVFLLINLKFKLRADYEVFLYFAKLFDVQTTKKLVGDKRL